PLAQARLYLETLRLGRFHTAEQRERALETIDRETSRLATLVDNVLYFDRAARGAARPEPVPTDLAAEASAAAQAFEPLARARRMDVVVDTEADARARIVPEELQQVLANLLDNAAKYGPEGQSIRLGVARRNGVVEIAVSDAGPGVSAAERSSIWEPFRRGASGAADVAGSGIGLAVVREIVERHGGRVRVEDAPGGGARFVVSLPALEGRS
ncbi:MAG: HAMP domain-containing sensor histidine kinase, partial [Gemmatimonadota bacterium]